MFKKIVQKIKRKEKTKIAQLVQSPKDKAIIVNLAMGEEAIITGTMAGCCSVVVQWGHFVNASGYRYMRGHHGGGGPGAINWELLFDKVPNSVATRMVMSCAKMDFKLYVPKVKAALLKNKIIVTPKFFATENAYIGRDKSIVDYKSLDPDDFKIRKPVGFGY